MAPPGAIRMDETSGRDWVALAGTSATRGAARRSVLETCARSAAAAPRRRAHAAAPFERSGPAELRARAPSQQPNPSHDRDWDQRSRNAS
jgi:hypothetical protein